MDFAGPHEALDRVLGLCVKNARFGQMRGQLQLDTRVDGGPLFDAGSSVRTSHTFEACVPLSMHAEALQPVPQWGRDAGNECSTARFGEGA
jgi:hypothetical protein